MFEDLLAFGCRIEVGRGGAPFWSHPRHSQLDARPQLNLEGGHLEGFAGWARQDSNLGPTDYESAALTAELRAPAASLAPLDRDARPDR